MSAVHFDREGRARCGTLGRSPRLVADESAVTCLACLNLIAGTHAVGNRRSDVKPCGTLAALRRHQRRKERVDDACPEARRQDEADRKARRRREQNEEVLAA